MRIVMAAVMAWAAAACGGGDGGGAPDAPIDDDPLMGGTIVTPCGDTAMTHFGATVPVAVPAGTGVIGPGATAKQIHLGHYGDASTSVAVVWRTDDNLTTTATTVRYGVAAAGEAYRADGTLMDSFMLMK